MDHGHTQAVGNQKREYVPCPHGMCLNHSPKWENIGEPFTEPNPRFGFFSIYLIYWHCGKPMRVVRQIQLRRCTLCGRQGKLIDRWHVNALCACCGYNEKHVGD